MCPSNKFYKTYSETVINQARAEEQAGLGVEVQLFLICICSTPFWNQIDFFLFCWNRGATAPLFTTVRPAYQLETFGFSWLYCTFIGCCSYPIAWNTGYRQTGCLYPSKQLFRNFLDFFTVCNIEKFLKISKKIAY